MSWAVSHVLLGFEYIERSFDCCRLVFTYFQLKNHNSYRIGSIEKYCNGNHCHAGLGIVQCGYKQPLWAGDNGPRWLCHDWDGRAQLHWYRSFTWLELNSILCLSGGHNQRRGGDVILWVYALHRGRWCVHWHRVFCAWVSFNLKIIKFKKKLKK